MTDNLTKVITPTFRMSFPNLPPMAPRKDALSGRETYGVTLLLPPGSDLTPFRAALKQAVISKFGPDAKGWPKIKRKPDDVITDFAAYNSDSRKPLPGDWTGWTKISASANTKYPPDVFHNCRTATGDLQRVTDEKEIYGGRWARAVLNAFFYDIKGSGSGVTFGLQSVQILKHDTSFGGRANAAADFSDDTIPAEYRDTIGPAVVDAGAAAGW